LRVSRQRAPTPPHRPGAGRVSPPRRGPPPPRGSGDAQSGRTAHRPPPPTPCGAHLHGRGGLGPRGRCSSRPAAGRVRGRPVERGSRRAATSGSDIGGSPRPLRPGSSAPMRTGSPGRARSWRRIARPVAGCGNPAVAGSLEGIREDGRGAHPVEEPQMPATPRPRPSPASPWHRNDPRHDRAAGAWIGAAAAACIVGAPPAMAEEAAHPDGDGSGPALLAWLVTTALHGLRDPSVIAKAVDTDPEQAWTCALRATVAHGTVPAPDPAVPPHTPLGAGWHAARTTPAPALEPARAVFPCSQLVEAVWRAYAAAGDEAAMYAGAMAGARWGVSGIPLQAQRRLTDITPPRPLITRAVVLARGSAPGAWPESDGLHTGAHPSIEQPFHTPHPHDPGVVLGNLSYLRSAPEVDAVVSLNRLGP